jgi:sRNA-binding carbon storage regulator CsrA
MLILGRKHGQGIEIDLGNGEKIAVYVQATTHTRARLLIDAPRQYEIGRCELPKGEPCRTTTTSHG